jgi:hypothetical protein
MKSPKITKNHPKSPETTRMHYLVATSVRFEISYFKAHCKSCGVAIHHGIHQKAPKTTKNHQKSRTSPKIT